MRKRDEQRSSIDYVLPSGHVVGLRTCALGVSTVLTATNYACGTFIFKT